MTDKITRKVLDIIASRVQSPHNSQPANLEAKFADFGMDSLDALEVFMDLEEEFDIKLPDEEVDQLATLADLVAFIRAQPNTSSSSPD